MTEETGRTIGERFTDWRIFVYGKFAKVFGESVPDLVRDGAYAISDIVALPEVAKMVYDHIMSYVESSVQSPLLDFSTPENTAISAGKIALTGLSVAIGVDTGRRGIKYFDNRRIARMQSRPD